MTRAPASITAVEPTGPITAPINPAWISFFQTARRLAAQARAAEVSRSRRAAADMATETGNRQAVQDTDGGRHEKV